MAASKKSEAYFDAESKKLDANMIAAFKKNNVEVITMTEAEYNAWLGVAKQSSYKTFASQVPDGQKLIDAALAVK